MPGQGAVLLSSSIQRTVIAAVVLALRLGAGPLGAASLSLCVAVVGGRRERPPWQALEGAGVSGASQCSAATRARRFVTLFH